MLLSDLSVDTLQELCGYLDGFFLAKLWCVGSKPLISKLSVGGAVGKLYYPLMTRFSKNFPFLPSYVGQLVHLESLTIAIENNSFESVIFSTERKSKFVELTQIAPDFKGLPRSLTCLKSDTSRDFECFLDAFAHDATLFANLTHLELSAFVPTSAPQTWPPNLTCLVLRLGSFSGKSNPASVDVAALPQSLQTLKCYANSFSFPGVLPISLTSLTATLQVIQYDLVAMLPENLQHLKIEIQTMPQTQEWDFSRLPAKLQYYNTPFKAYPPSFYEYLKQSTSLVKVKLGYVEDRVKLLNSLPPSVTELSLASSYERAAVEEIVSLLPPNLRSFKRQYGLSAAFLITSLPQLPVGMTNLKLVAPYADMINQDSAYGLDVRQALNFDRFTALTQLVLQATFEHPSAVFRILPTHLEKLTVQGYNVYEAEDLQNLPRTLLSLSVLQDYRYEPHPPPIAVLDDRVLSALPPQLTRLTIADISSPTKPILCPYNGTSGVPIQQFPKSLVFLSLSPIFVERKEWFRTLPHGALTTLILEFYRNDSLDLFSQHVEDKSGAAMDVDGESGEVVQLFPQNLSTLQFVLPVRKPETMVNILKCVPPQLRTLNIRSNAVPASLFDREPQALQAVPTFHSDYAKYLPRTLTSFSTNVTHAFRQENPAEFAPLRCRFVI